MNENISTIQTVSAARQAVAVKRQRSNCGYVWTADSRIRGIECKPQADKRAS